MNPNNLTWRPPTTKELLAGLTLFVIPILASLLKLVFGYQLLIGQMSSIIAVALLIIILAVLLFTGAVATHALARAALQDKMHPLVSMPGKGNPGGKLIEMAAEDAVVPVTDLVPIARIKNRLNPGGSKP